MCVDVCSIYFPYELCPGLGTISKVLLISTVARSVQCAGFGALRPLCVFCVSVVRSIVVLHK